MRSALYFTRQYSEPSVCEMLRPYIIIFSHQEKPYSKEIRPGVSRRRKHGVRGLGTRDGKLDSRELGGERRESRGRGLSVHLHNQNTLHAIEFPFTISIYCRFLLNVVFQRMTLHPLS